MRSLLTCSLYLHYFILSEGTEFLGSQTYKRGNRVQGTIWSSPNDKNKSQWVSEEAITECLMVETRLLFLWPSRNYAVSVCLKCKAKSFWTVHFVEVSLQRCVAV